jgi:TolB protein
MANKLRFIPFFAFILLFIYGCTEPGPTIGNNSGSGSNHAPELPKNPFPHNDTTGAPRILTISWTCEDPDAGDTVKFDIKMANVNPPDLTLVTDITTPYYSVPYLLAADSTFYWRVTAKDNHGAVTSGNVWKFRTGSTY